VYDWGSSTVATLLESGDLDFEAFKNKVKRQEKFNRTKEFIDRLVSSNTGYRKVVIFVDNSGCDVIFGVIPFARYKYDLTFRYLMSKGAKVILAANSEPSLNDITATELEVLMERIICVDEVIASAWKSDKLKVMESGSASPTIDLGRLDAALVKECRDCDLIVLEGMGRVS
jgi:uncharacterized protein with ATP-grasp and redox domains